MPAVGGRGTVIVNGTGTGLQLSGTQTVIAIGDSTTIHNAGDGMTIRSRRNGDRMDIEGATTPSRERRPDDVARLRHDNTVTLSGDANSA